MHKKFIIKREISWLSFNARVLQEASDPTLPLKERIRFLGIYSNNRDEFFRVRVPVLKKMIHFSEKKPSNYLGKHPEKILDQIHHILLNQQLDFNRVWKKILHDLKEEKVFLVDDKHLNAKQKTFVREFFDQEVSSSIIPLFIEQMAHLPFFGDQDIFLGILMQKKKGASDHQFALIQIPTTTHGRFISLPAPKGEQQIMLLEDLIRFNLPRLFSPLGYTHFEAHMFKITKDAEINLDHDLSTTFIQKIENGVKNRRKAKPIRFLYDKKMNKELLNFLIHKFNFSHKDSIIPGGHIRNFRDFMEFPALLPDHEKRPSPFKHPAFEKALRISDVIMKEDLILHFPYHSFNSVIDLLREAAMDPAVLSIKITAYRLAKHSKICNALINAARNGKEVHVILELRATFDEKANLEWKTKLEEEGVKVFVDIPLVKVHAKLCVIKKRVENRIEQYGFIGTGNLNEKTALSYIDHLLLTSNPEIIADINHLFKALENPKENWHHLNLCKRLLVSPVNLRQALSSKINREISAAKAGKPAKILLNLNSLSDEKLIKKLYRAAEAGVEIKLIVRGIFSATADQKTFQKPMKAVSIVDRYLEHSRLFLFHNLGEEEIYLSSADWMTRNMDYRLEAAVPILDKTLKEELNHILKIKLSDNVKARLLDEELSNHYVYSTGKRSVRSQSAIYNYLKGKKVKSLK